MKPMQFMKAALIVVLALAPAGCEQSAQATSASPKQNPVERGRYLVTVAGCNDCHSPKMHPGTMQPDPARLLSGRPASTPAPEKPATMGEIVASGDLTAWSGPWGVSYASNLTPDPTTGIGKRYNEAAFLHAMRTGQKPEGTELMPPMPWPDFAQMNDSDLKAIWAYLQTLKPVENNVRVATRQERPVSAERSTR